MAKRVKSDKANLVEVASWRHADELVRQIALHQRTIQQFEAATARKVEQAKADMAARTKVCQDAIADCLRSLEAFATIHKADFEKQKSKKLNFGVLGWRKGTSIRVKKTTIELIKQVFSRAKAALYIHVKETVNKEALAKLTDEQLADVGARRDSKDVFFVEPDLTQAADYK